MAQDLQELLEKYDHFNDGLILSFEYFYAPKEELAARVVLYARNQKLKQEGWNKVEIAIKDVQELNAKVSGKKFNSICCGVKMVKFGDSWCLDVDGVYKKVDFPNPLTKFVNMGNVISSEEGLMQPSWTKMLDGPEKRPLAFEGKPG